MDFEELLRKKVFNHYNNRDEKIIYAHYLEQPIFNALTPRELEDINNHMVIGELIHQGLSSILGKCGEHRKAIQVYDYEIQDILDIAHRFILEGDVGKWVVIAGSPDACIVEDNHKIPIELKTTRKDIQKPYWKWIHRIKIYSFLLDAPHGYIVVINLPKSEIKTFKIENNLSLQKVKEIVLDWMRGKYPFLTFDGFIISTS